jgi:hypothetical protein
MQLIYCYRRIIMFLSKEYPPHFRDARHPAHRPDFIDPEKLLFVGEEQPSRQKADSSGGRVGARDPEQTLVVSSAATVASSNGLTTEKASAAAAGGKSGISPNGVGHER